MCIRDRAIALHDRALVNIGGLDHEILRTHAVLVLGVGGRRRDDLGNDLGNRALVEAQDVQSVDDFLAADLVNDDTRLARRNANVLRNSFSLHLRSS